MPLAEEYGISSVLAVVEDIYGLQGAARGDEFDMLCPVHDDSKPSCSVNLVTGLYKCLACGAAGDLVQLGTVALDAPYQQVLDAIRPGAPEAIATKVNRHLSKIRQASARNRSKLPPVPQHYETQPLHELLARGFTEHTLDRWGIQYVPWEVLTGNKGSFTIRHSIGIPIRMSPREPVVAWCYRRTSKSDPWQPRYLYTPLAQLSRLWFGLYHHYCAEEIVVVEGALDTMWLDQCGVPALALLGSQLSTAKVETLLRYKQVTILTDRDQAGVNAALKIGKALHPKVPVRIARYLKKSVATDPADMHPIDVELSLASSVPWATWRRKFVQA